MKLTALMIIVLELFVCKSFSTDILEEETLQKYILLQSYHSNEANEVNSISEVICGFERDGLVVIKPSILQLSAECFVNILYSIHQQFTHNDVNNIKWLQFDIDVDTIDVANCADKLKFLVNIFHNEITLGWFLHFKFMNSEDFQVFFKIIQEISSKNIYPIIIKEADRNGLIREGRKLFYIPHPTDLKDDEYLISHYKLDRFWDEANICFSYVF